MTETHRPGCLEANMLAEYIDGGLEPRERAKVEEHLAECSECYENFAETVRISASAAQATAPAARRGIWLPVAASIVIVALGAATYVRWFSERAEIARAVSIIADSRTDRPVDGRLSLAPRWKPLGSASRGSADSVLSGRATSALGTIRESLERRRTADHLGASATADLLVGRVDDAVAALEESVGLDDTSAERWSDLAVAYLSRAISPQQSAELPKALNAVERAIAIDATLQAALFNRGVILERLGLKVRAAEAFDQAAAIDPGTDWAREASERARRLRAPATAAQLDVQGLIDRLLNVELPAWAGAVRRGDSAASQTAWRSVEGTAGQLARGSRDTFIAAVVSEARASESRGANARVLDGLAVLGQGRASYARDEFEPALPKFVAARAAFAKRAPALEITSRLSEAMTAYRLNQVDHSRELLITLQRDAAEYPWVQGRIDSNLGLISLSAGRIRESASTYERALAAFENVGDAGNAAVVRGLLATTYEQLGDPVRLWEHRVAALRGSEREGVMLRAAIESMRGGWPLAAVEFAEAARALSITNKRQTTEVDSLRWLATIEGQRGQSAAVRQYLADARAIAGSRHDASWTRLRAEIDFAEAVAADPEGTAEALAASDRALAFFQALGPSSLARLPELYLARGRLFSQRAAWDQAELNLKLGLDVLSSKRTTLPSTVDQATLSDIARRFGEELVRVAVKQGNDGAAFMAIESLRGWDLGAAQGTTPTDSAQLLSNVPADAIILSYVVGDQQSYVWTAAKGHLQIASINATRREIATLVAAARPPRFDASARNQLSRLLLDPVRPALKDRTTVAIVPDGPLHLLPFASLSGAASEFLIEEHPLVVGPSVRWLLDASRVLGRTAPRTLSVGNPAFDRKLWPNLADLPGAAREAAAIQAAVGGSIMTGSDATHDALIASLTTTDRFHFGGHAVVNDFNAGLSSLLLAGDQPVTAAEIRALDLHQMDLAVLASCDGARGFMPRAEGPLGLARAFLAAGARSVVSALWQVQDAPSAEFFVRFHRAARSDGAAAALQAAQMASIKSGDPAQRSLAHWSSFISVSKLVSFNQRN